MKDIKIIVLLIFTGALGISNGLSWGDQEAEQIQPWKEDPRYWQYQGEPVLLIGASNQDNLFNHPNIRDEGLEAHLDEIISAGGNYVRNTMSSRDEGNAWPFHRDEETGLYDLERFNEEYQERLNNFLEMTAERGIFVQIELWDRFDYAREPWEQNPFNPKNNSNYTAEESGLPEKIETHPGERENPFFRSVPELDNNELILPIQEAHIRQVLETSLPYDHVLYCISNETNDTEEWSTYWAEMLHRVAENKADQSIIVTEMWDPWDLREEMHERTFDHPERYRFVDVSQNTHQQGQTQWDNLQWVRERVSDPPRPVNNVKMYGGNHGGGPEEGQHKLWRNVLGGTASARYHRPGGGMGLNDTTKAHLKSLNMMLEQLDIFEAEPNLDLLSEREDDEAFLAADPGTQYALYFPRGGTVQLDLENTSGTFKLRWLDVLNARWEEETKVSGGQSLELKPPRDEPFGAVLVR